MVVTFVPTTRHFLSSIRKDALREGETIEYSIRMRAENPASSTLLLLVSLTELSAAGRKEAGSNSDEKEEWTEREEAE